MNKTVSFKQQGRIGIITIDNPPVNALSQQVRSELLKVLSELQTSDDLDALLIACAGRTFIAGADITEFELAEIPKPDFNEVQGLIERFNIPVIAVLHGSVLGGGLELALSCHYRVAINGTRFGLPEVTLGVIPGSGGTQRLPRLITPAKALDLIVTGRLIDSFQAANLGLIDAIFENNLDPNAITFAKSIIGEPINERVLSDKELILDDRFSDDLEALSKKIPSVELGGQAARVAIECVLAGAKMPFNEALKFEREQFLLCKDSLQSKALRHVFFAQRKAMQIPGLDKNIKEREIKTVGVIGAGTMGTGITICFASAGFNVILLDSNNDNLIKAEESLGAFYQREIDKGRLTQEKLEHCLSLIKYSNDDHLLKDADLIIEAAYEDLKVKQSIFKKIGKIAKQGAILATNTSTLNVNLLAESSGRLADVVGLHFFSPANIMKLLEIVRTDYVADDVLQSALSTARRIGKIPVVSGVCFGFIGNRMLEGYIREAEALLLEGATPQQVDHAIEGFGFRMGPCRMMDMAGIDIGAKIVIEQKKADQLPDDPNYRVAVQEMYRLGRLGQKSGKGYYKYEGRNAIEDPEVIQIFSKLAQKNKIRQRKNISQEEIINRCLLPLILEGYKILDEGIAYRASDIDVVWTSGYGFPAWRGGPMFYAETIGLVKLLEQVEEIRNQTGNKFNYWDLPKLLRN